MKTKLPPSQRDKRSRREQKPLSWQSITRKGQLGATSEILNEGKTEEKLVEVTKNAHAYLDALHHLYQKINEVKVACGKGCSYCCYHNVDITFPEAVLLARAIRPEQWETVKQRCREYISKSSPGLLVLDDVQPCPLLTKDEECCVYEHRPLACRGFFSESVEPCKRGMTDPSIPMRAPGIEITWASYAAVSQALQNHRLDGDRLPLAKALLRMLEHPELVQQYLQGGEL